MTMRDRLAGAGELAGLLAKALHNQVLDCKFTEEAEYTACPGPEYHAWMAAQVAKDLLERLPPSSDQQVTLDEERLARAIDKHEHVIGWDRECEGAYCAAAIIRALREDER